MKRTNKLVGEGLGMLGSILINSILNLTVIESSSERFIIGFSVAVACITAGGWVMNNIGIINENEEEKEH